MTKKHLLLVFLIFVFLFSIQASPGMVELGEVIKEGRDDRTMVRESPLASLNLLAGLKEENDYIAADLFSVNYSNNRSVISIGEAELLWQEANRETGEGLVADARAKFDQELDARLEEITGQGFIKALDEDYRTYNLFAEIKTHKVRPGESLWTIARSYNINIDTLIGANDINDMNSIMPGDELTILPVAGILYRVGPGDSFNKLVRKYALDPAEVLKANGVSNPNKIRPGDSLLLPGAKPEFGYQDRLNQLFIRPVGGRISSPYGPRWGSHHDGIDYAVSIGTPVKSAGGGRIVYVGWSSGYGKTVIVEHQRGMRTLYAHLNSYNVRTGQRVNRGQTVAYSGNTGRSTGPHLHFEVRVNGRPTNPQGYLRN